MPSTLRCPGTSRQLDFPPSMNCQACGSALAATAKFCHKCGARVSAQMSAGHAVGWRAGLPWGVTGAALGALLTVLALRIGAASGGGMRDAGDTADDDSRSTPPDISQMSPEERATRRSEAHTSELQSQSNLVCRLLLEKKKNIHEDRITKNKTKVIHQNLLSMRSN